MIALVAAVILSVDPVIEALGERDCPRVFSMLSADMQKFAPKETWPPFCNSIGMIRSVVPQGGNGYRVVSETGTWNVFVARAGGKITGLGAKPWEVALTMLEKLAQVSARHGLPGIAALTLDGDEVVWGFRKLGDPTLVAKGDKWQLGSDGKAMTATLAAILVEEKKLSWSTKSGAATLEQLLQHRGGAELGTFAYSNDGYVAVGEMIAKTGGEPFEAQMKKRVFEPLGMKSCGFGPPDSPGKVDQPWGHEVFDGAPLPRPRADNPPAYSAAGTIHCALADWAKFVSAHLAGEKGEKTALPLTQATFKKLHTPNERYAMGWGVAEGVWVHDGSNTTSSALAYALPAAGRALLVATNRGDEEASKAMSEVRDFWLTRR